jgi:hypothetical protein
MKPCRLILAFAFALSTAAGLAIAAGAVETGPTGSDCPTTAPMPATGSTGSARGVLVPTGASSLLLCRYHGLNPPATAHRLERARLLTAAKQIAELTTELDALPQPSGVVHCPMDDGSEITATFDYPHTRSATVDVGLTGCRTVSRGKLIRTAGAAAGSRLIDQLAALDP